MLILLLLIILFLEGIFSILVKDVGFFSEGSTSMVIVGVEIIGKFVVKIVNSLVLGFFILIV